jgi:hypothetical protein
VVSWVRLQTWVTSIVRNEPKRGIAYFIPLYGTLHLQTTIEEEHMAMRSPLTFVLIIFVLMPIILAPLDSGFA